MDVGSGLVMPILRKTPARIAEGKPDADVEREGIARRRLNLTTGEWQVLEPLMKREAMSYEGLIALIFGDHPPALPYNAITQRTHFLRKKLAAHGIQIRTLDDFGYAIEPADKARLKEILAPINEGD